MSDPKLVELVRVSGVRAQIIAAQLRSAEIRVVVFGVGTAGALSAVQFAQGSRVMVHDHDIDSARELLRTIEGTLDDLEPFSDEELSALAEAAGADANDQADGAVV